MEGFRETAIIAGAEFWRTLRSARVVVLLLLFLMFTGVSGVAVQGCASGINKQTQAQAAKLEEAGVPAEEIERATEEGKQEARRQFVAAFFSDDEALTNALLATPLVLLVLFKLTLFFLPLYIAIMGFDQISSELGPRSIRYLTVRSRRSSVLFGKYGAQAGVLALLLLVVDVVICVFGRFAYDDFSTGEMFVTLGKFWLSGLVFSLAYLALASLCSTLSRQPALSLITNLIALFFIWLFAFLGDPPSIGGQPLFSAVRGVQYASVWYFRTDLLHPEPGRFLIAGLSHLGFGAVFLGLGWLVLRRRDL